MEELIGLIIFMMIMRLLAAGRQPAAPPARRPAPAGGGPAPAKPASGETAAEFRDLVHETLREAFPAAFPPVRPGKVVRPRRRAEPPSEAQPAPVSLQAAPESPPTEMPPRVDLASALPGVHELGDPRVAARAVVLAEIFSAPRCRRPHLPSAGR